MREDLQKKIEQSIKLLKIACKGKKVELAYSGGKDSDVILQLAKEAGIDYVPIYKMTTIDPPLTIKHAKDNGCTIMRPKRSFFKIVEACGIPSRFRRFCCAELKEYKVMDDAIIGVRRAESVKRAARYKEPIVCRVYNKKDHVNQILPILEWTNQDVEEFIADRGIKCHPLYYDEQGNFYVERRLGCIGCPLISKRKVVDMFKEYPKFAKAFIKAIDKFIKSHPSAKILNYCEDAYQVFYLNYFYTGNLKEFKDYIGGGIFGEEPDIKKYLEDLFNTNLNI